MTYDLFLGDRTFSSWSLRGWLMFEKFNIPYRTHMVGIYNGTKMADLAPVSPAETVPVMRDADGIVVGDTLAMAETLAERHPEAGHWPHDGGLRGMARWMVAEMHSGFGALRGDCPMQLMHQAQGFAVSDAVRLDLARIERLWQEALDRSGGPWLMGDYCLADVFYAPVAARIAGYRLPVSDATQAYVDLTLSETSFRQWRAMGLTKSYDPVPYETGLPKAPWPGPEILSAQAIETGTSENTHCPYSGDAVTHFLDLDGRVFGFCNAFCRDKTVQDPGAWPDFMDLFS